MRRGQHPPWASEAPPRRSGLPGQVSCQGLTEPATLAGLAEDRVSRAAAVATLAIKSTLAQEALPVCLPSWPARMGPQGPQHWPVQGRHLASALWCWPSAVGTGAWRTGP